MPTGNPLSGGVVQARANALATKPNSNPKSLTISPAMNGFIVQMQKTTEYGQDYAVATSLEDIARIIGDYLS
jgi:hypothetical protein